jgi:hypothetical protein
MRVVPPTASRALACLLLWLGGCARPIPSSTVTSERSTSAAAPDPVPQVGPDPHPYVERGQLTDETGVCDAGDGACARTTTAELTRCYLGLREKIGRGFEIVPNASVSPHYGGRFITLTWRGGRCEFGDSPGSKLTGPDTRRFEAAYDGALKVLLAAAKGDGGARPCVMRSGRIARAFRGSSVGDVPDDAADRERHAGRLHDSQ